jgi:hypothetical protein
MKVIKVEHKVKKPEIQIDFWDLKNGSEFHMIGDSGVYIKTTLDSGQFGMPSGIYDHTEPVSELGVAIRKGSWVVANLCSFEKPFKVVLGKPEEVEEEETYTVELSKKELESLKP